MQATLNPLIVGPIYSSARALANRTHSPTGRPQNGEAPLYRHPNLETRWILTSGCGHNAATTMPDRSPPPVAIAQHRLQRRGLRFRKYQVLVDYRVTNNITYLKGGVWARLSGDSEQPVEHRRGDRQLWKVLAFSRSLSRIRLSLTHLPYPCTPSIPCTGKHLPLLTCQFC